MPFIAIVHVPDHTTPWVINTMITPTLPEGYRLVGVFDFPNRSELKCSGSCTVKHTGQWVRDRRGFMKCGICGYRNKRLRRWLIGHLFDLLGANLYEDAPAAFHTPKGFADND
jgi:hypothetical protein